MFELVNWYLALDPFFKFLFGMIGVWGFVMLLSAWIWS
jgi:hypothetical protein